MSKNLQSVVVWFSFWLLPFLFYFSCFWWLPLHKLSAKGFTAAGTPPTPSPHHMCNGFPQTSSNIWAEAEAAETESRYLQVLQSIRANSDCDSVGGFAASCNKSRNSTHTHTHAHAHIPATPAGERRELAASVFDLALCFSLLGILIKNASTWNTNVLGVFGGNSGWQHSGLPQLAAVEGGEWACLSAFIGNGAFILTRFTPRSANVCVVCMWVSVRGCAWVCMRVCLRLRLQIFTLRFITPETLSQQAKA